MGQRSGQRERPPLNAAALDELALHYVGRFATTRAKLRIYLARKIRERGWDGEREPDLEGIAERVARLGYVDDAAYALSKSQALTGRGYGERRVRHSLRAAGVLEEDARPAEEAARDDRVEAALTFARRRRMGPFAPQSPDRDQQERWLAALVRAGHSFQLARFIVSREPGEELDIEALAEMR